MVRNRNCLQGLLAAAGMLVLILDSGLALEGARDGLTLCIQTVIPSLFPFFVLSSVLLSALSEQDSILIKLLAKKLMIPQRAASLVIPGFLGGYPVGAKCVADLYESRQISKKDAQRLLAFCSNAGPEEPGVGLAEESRAVHPETTTHPAWHPSFPGRAG